jgi:hypothetical protein
LLIQPLQLETPFGADHALGDFQGAAVDLAALAEDVEPALAVLFIQRVEQIGGE